MQEIGLEITPAYPLGLMARNGSKQQSDHIGMRSTHTSIDATLSPHHVTVSIRLHLLYTLDIHEYQY